MTYPSEVSRQPSQKNWATVLSIVGEEWAEVLVAVSRFIDYCNSLPSVVMRLYVLCILYCKHDLNGAQNPNNI